MNRFVTYGIHRVWPAWQASKREGDGREREKGMGRETLTLPLKLGFSPPLPLSFFRLPRRLQRVGLHYSIELEDLF